MNPSLEPIKGNLFPASHAAIGDWNKFPWHRWQGAVQAHKPQSSQALAIDVFGTIKVSDERNRVLGELAQRCGLPGEGPWTLELEWTDPDNLLGEPTPTQMDAIAFGRNALIVIECKFTELGGGCSQTASITSGPNMGLRQCSGEYASQTNPVNNRASRCALSGKGVRYWMIIPQIYGLDAECDHRPCPFAGEAYQWMRNVVLADRLAAARGISGTVVAAYADANRLPTADKARSWVIHRLPAQR